MGLKCTESTGAVHCDLEDLTNGSNTTVILVVNVNASFRGTIIHVVNVVANEPNVDPLDNTATEETEINPEADLTITR